MENASEPCRQYAADIPAWNKLVCDFVESSARGENPDRGAYLSLLSDKTAKDKFVAITNMSLLLMIAHRGGTASLPNLTPVGVSSRALMDPEMS